MLQKASKYITGMKNDVFLRIFAIIRVIVNSLHFPAPKIYLLHKRKLTRIIKCRMVVLVRLFVFNPRPIVRFNKNKDNERGLYK